MNEKEIKFNSKNYAHYPDCWYWLWDWALPLRINCENTGKDYFEIDVQVLCVHFTYVRISHIWQNLTGNSPKR